MISYRHIPTNWNTFLPPDMINDNRRVMMCGRKAMYRLCGIPGVSEQDAIVNDRPGWCIKCLVDTLDKAETTIVTLPELQAVYDVMTKEIIRCLDEVQAMINNVVSKKGQ